MINNIVPFSNQNNINNYRSKLSIKPILKTGNGAERLLYTSNANNKQKFESPQHNSFVLTKNIAFSGRLNLQDIKYRNKLAMGINNLFPDLKCSTNDLKSIIGVEELTKALRGAKPENFSTGQDLKNVKNGVFNINLHTHTNESDGSFTVEELLNSAAEYANSIKKPVYWGITNHDSINDLVTAVQIVAKNKEKFKNLKVVLGVEFNAKYENAEMFSKPLQLEMIGYCVNPFDSKFNKFMKDIKTGNIDYAQSFIMQFNKKYGTQVDFASLKDYDSSLRNGGSPSFLWKLKEYLSKKTAELGCSDEYVESIFKANAEKYGDLAITPITPSMKEIIDVVNNTSGMVGMAHPVRNRIGWKINASTREEREAKYYKTFYEFIKDFKALGGKILEADYQYLPKHLEHPAKREKEAFIHNVCKELDLLSSSGLDNHHKDLFSP